MKTDSLTGMCVPVALLSSLAILVAAARADATAPGVAFVPNPRVPAWLSPAAELAPTHAGWWDSDASHWDRFPGGDLWTDYCDAVSCLGRHATVALGPHARRTEPREAGGCPPPRPVWDFVRELLGWRTCCCADCCGGTRPPRGSSQPRPVVPEPTPAAEPTDRSADIESPDPNTTRDLSRHDRPGAERNAPLPLVTDPAPAVPRESAAGEATDLPDRVDLQPVPADDPPPVPPSPADADRKTPIPRNELPPMEPSDPEVSRRDRSVPRMANRLSDFIQTR